MPIDEPGREVRIRNIMRGGHDRARPGGSWQAPARRTTHAAGRGPARRSIKSFVYNDPAELERVDDFVVQRPIAGKNHAD